MSTTATGSIEEFHRGPYLVSTDRERLDERAIHAFLTTSYWAEGIPLDVVRRSLAGSLCFGLYRDREQVGLTRVITDSATFAYLADVYVLPEHRGHGLGRWLIECVMASRQLQGLRRWLLATRDAHRLYQKYGFGPPANPDGFMEILHRDHYRPR